MDDTFVDDTHFVDDTSYTCVYAGDGEIGFDEFIALMQKSETSSKVLFISFHFPVSTPRL